MIRWWSWEYVFFILSYWHQMGIIIHWPLFWVRSWNNGIRCMFYYALMKLNTIFSKQRLISQCPLIPLQWDHVGSYFLKLKWQEWWLWSPAPRITDIHLENHWPFQYHWSPVNWSHQSSNFTEDRQFKFLPLGSYLLNNIRNFIDWTFCQVEYADCLTWTFFVWHWC